MTSENILPANQNTNNEYYSACKAATLLTSKEIKTESDTSFCPDLTPVLLVLPSIANGITTINIGVTITELSNVDTDGSPILVRMTSDARLTFTSAPSNFDWNYLGDNGFVHTFAYNGPNGIISAGSQSSFQIMTMYDPQTTSGQTTVTLTLVPFSGGECNMANSTDSERITYFG